MINILVLLLSIAIMCLAIGWAFGGIAAGATAGFLATLVGVLVGLRLAKASHLSTSLLVMAVAVAIGAAGYKLYENHVAESQRKAAESKTLDVTGRVIVNWRGALDIGQTGSFTLPGVSGFQEATTTFQVTDEYPGQGTCAADTTLTVTAGSANNPQDGVMVGPFTSAEQSADLTIPAGADVLDGTVGVQNTQSSDYEKHCPVMVGIERVIIHH